MYNDENNLYHYTYRKDGSEAGSENGARAENSSSGSPSIDEQLHSYRERQSGQQTAEPGGPQPPVQNLKPVREKKRRSAAVKFTALALACALVGGAAGAGITAAVTHTGGGEETINVSNRTASKVSLKTVNGKDEMSDAENYAANVSSVVSINTSGTTTNFFGQAVEEASAGTGFIITSDGYIATNHHVIADANSVKVTLHDGKSYDAAVVGSDEDYDIAVLKIDVSGLQAVTLGDSDTLNVGDQVLAIGNPLGELTFSMSGGMVSCVNRAINVDGTPFNMIQTDASINAGNSGGPLLNKYGEVVGIVSAKYSSGSSSSGASIEGLGFAIPINDVAAMIQDIMTNGYVTNKPYLGITAGTMNQQMAQQTNLTQGVYVYSVEAGGAAEKAGLKVGDVITKVGSTDISSMEDLTAAKKSYSAGDQTDFTVYRGGKSVKVTVTWGSQPAASKSSGSTAQNQQNSQDSQNGQNSQNGQQDQDMQGLFDYFFNQYGGSSGSGTGRSGNDTAA
ncbi:MAG: trypsin-like peptidase domain-containing protein [Oscillibacter sp.]|jgi:serine protease Do|nr:trypsin-like peptidase domain-containing protein [Oscillibacter sp.]